MKRDRAVVRNAVHARIRRKLSGTGERPRLAIFRSLNHIYAQVIDDHEGRTLVSASSTEKDLRGATGGNIAAAETIGRTIAERAKEKGINAVVFDRGGYRYHGRVKALADAVRAAGLIKGDVASEDGEQQSEQGEAAEETAA